MDSNELQFALWATVGLLGWLAIRALRKFLAKPASPDPWGPEVSAALEQADATPICPHCQCPHEATRWFCPECGRAVGDYNNVNPYLYLFSLGEVLREGTSGRVRKSWLTIAGFLVLSAVEYLVLAPIYWFFLFRNLSHQAPESPVSDAPPLNPRS